MLAKVYSAQRVVQQRQQINEQKRHRLQQMQIMQRGMSDVEELYQLNRRIYDECFTFDSELAMSLVDANLQIARQRGDRDGMAEWQIQRSFILASTGQLLEATNALDGLKLASINTPDVLASSLSVVGGLLLGDFAVTVGWLSPDVILYMAFVAIANFTQSSYELGYAFKFLRMLTLLLTAAFDWIGFLAGILIAFALALSNRTLDGRRRYLWPLLPWNRDAMARLLFRMKKRD